MKVLATLLLAGALLLALFPLAGIDIAQAWSIGEPIVPCQKDCTDCDLYKLIENLLDFVLIGLVPIAGGILFSIAGFYVLMGGANPTMLSKGKDIFKNTFYAIIVISLAWLITNTIIINLGQGVGGGGNWYELDCPVS